ncbi:MAG: Mor transcription activator family protein [Brevinema sp.]
METSMLQFVRNISDSKEEFLAIIKAINQWGIMAKKNLEDKLFTCLLTLDGLVFPKMSTEQLSNLQRKQFKTEELIKIVDKISPNTGRIKTLALIYYFGRKSVHIPTLSSAKRLIRNENIYDSFKAGSSYQVLAHTFQISERWIRIIVEAMRKRRKT